MPRVLHLLSQRPSRTGSGITLDALVRHAGQAGWQQEVVVGVPADDPRPQVGGLPDGRVHPLRFGEGSLEFPVPGMSDVMPYPSTRFSDLDAPRLARYRDAWCRHVGERIERFRPDVIHTHHLWILSSSLRDLAGDLPVVAQCHATGFRQMELCPHLADEVIAGCARLDRYVVLHAEHAARLAKTLGVAAERVHVVGAGYREDLFHTRGRAEGRRRLLFVGKFSASKGLPWLLDAFERLVARYPDLVLHVAGGGSGDEADRIAARMASMGPRVRVHGMLPQPELADLMRRTDVCVLPSFYEGLPLVLVEASACGNRLVASALPGVVDPVARAVGGAIELVEPPRMATIDVPVPDDLPGFVERLDAAIARSIEAPPAPTTVGLERFGWSAVFRRVEAVWQEAIDGAVNRSADPSSGG